MQTRILVAATARRRPASMRSEPMTKNSSRTVLFSSALTLLMLTSPGGAQLRTGTHDAVAPSGHSAVQAGPETFDLVVYGGTAGGVMTAVSAARHGLNVALLEPRDHLGGMTSGGLSRTDMGEREVIGGMALELYWRAGVHYNITQYAHDLAWFMEPKVAEQILRDMGKQAGVTTYFRHRLRESHGVRKVGARVVAITVENGAEFEAKVFADATYEGDLMAQAGVSYTWGRESIAQYGESLAGVRDKTPYHQFMVNIPAHDEQGRLLREISPDPPGSIGSADRKVQAYNFRMILSRDPANQVPYSKPTNYAPTRYELLARLLDSTTKQLGRPPVLNEVTLIAPIPNNKADFNNRGAFSTDYIGKNWEYPEASYERREEIRQEHVEYIAGFFWFLAHDPRVPKSLQDEVNGWGLARDEFVDTDHWPHQLYIREARRMIGQYVMTQKDLQDELMKPDAIGMGSYNSDSHNVQRIVNRQGFVENEGDMQVPVKPYQIPYRMIVPKQTEAENLLVPVCFSASHVAYSSLRMEPQYMIIGHAAGVAAKLAIDSAQPLQRIDTTALQQILESEGAIFAYVPASQRRVIGDFRERFLERTGPARADYH